MLVEGKHDRVACGQRIEHCVKGTTLGKHAESRSVEAARHQPVQPRRLDRAAHEMESATHLRVVVETRNR